MGKADEGCVEIGRKKSTFGPFSLVPYEFDFDLIRVLWVVLTQANSM
jgi:hypothetical protein